MSETEGLPTEPMEPEAPAENEPAAEPAPEPVPDEQTEPPAEDEPAANDVEAEPDAEAVAPPSEKEIEKIYKALGKLREQTAARVGTIMGDDAIALQPCPVCGGDIPGHVWQVPFEDTIEPIYANVRQWLGLGPVQQLKRHESFQTCTDCDGAGFIDTGSKRDGYESATCPRCSGKGYLSGLEVAQPALAAVPDAPAMWAEPPASNGEELPPEAQALRDKGWMVAPPINLAPTGPQV